MTAGGDPWAPAQAIADTHSLGLIRGKESGTLGLYDDLVVDSPAHAAAEEALYEAEVEYDREESYWRIWM